MARLLKVAEVAEMALAKIGAYSPNDAQADATEMARAIQWMDLGVAELSGTENVKLLESSTLSANLTAGVSEYVLADLFGVQWPDNDMAFPISATTRDTSGTVTSDAPVVLIDRPEWDAIENKSAAGRPCRAWIDRTVTPTIHFDLVPGTAPTYQFRLVIQTQSRDMRGGSPDGDGNVSHQFHAEWQRWLVLMTAAAIGAGPVRRLPQQEINDIRGEAASSLARLLAYANKWRTSPERQRTQAWGM
jgi:hypothetical protein